MTGIGSQLLPTSADRLTANMFNKLSASKAVLQYDRSLVCRVSDYLSDINKAGQRTIQPGLQPPVKC